MAFIDWESFRTQYVVVLTAFNLLRYVGIVDKAVSMIGGSLVTTALAWNLTKYLRKYIDREYISSLKKAVLITGTDKGLGHELAVKLNEHGFRVYATVMDEKSDGVDSLVKDSRFQNLMIVKQMDVTNEGQVNKVAKEVEEDLVANGEQLWAVVNAAEVQEFGHSEFSKFEMFEKIFDVNTFGTVRVVRAFLPLLRKSKGRIVNLESIGGRITLPKLTAYCMSKGANLAFADALRREMFDWGIKVSTVELAYDRKAGPVATQDKFSRSMSRQWANSAEHVRQLYSSEYMEQIKIENLSQIFKNNMDDVMDNVIDAVRGQEPAIRYTPYTSLKAKIWANGAQVVPTEWLDSYYHSMEKDSPKPIKPNEPSVAPVAPEAPEPPEPLKPVEPETLKPKTS